MTNNYDNVRQQMKSYWEVYAPSIESMMLSHDATCLTENEQNEILSYLPKYKGKRILELGAGIGRFTSRLAPLAESVTSVDFIDAYVKENEKQNKHFGNVTFVCADVTKLDFPPGEFDMVFSNWLLMYLTEQESRDLVNSTLKWLTPGGHLFIRESCYHQSGNLKRDENPTKYRTPHEYYDMLLGAEDKNNKTNTQLKLNRGKNILTYIHYHGNPNQMCFLAEKVVASKMSTQEFLDVDLFTLRNILCWERIFGHMWLSSGGEAKTREICARLGVRPGQNVLDVGCGTGGAAFFLARHYSVNVHAVDLSTNVITVAIDRQGKQEMAVKKKVQFEICDITNVEYEEEAYDAIYSRDTVLHVADKQKLFNQFFKWLKPGGILLICDYCTGDKENNNAFNEYVKRRGYTLTTIKEYSALLKKSGFKHVNVEDQTVEFTDIMKKELSTFLTTKDAFSLEFSKEEFQRINNDWEAKIQRCENGDQKLGLFVVTK